MDKNYNANSGNINVLLDCETLNANRFYIYNLFDMGDFGICWFES